MAAPTEAQNIKITLANGEPSTHGAKRTLALFPTARPGGFNGPRKKLLSAPTLNPGVLSEMGRQLVVALYVVAMAAIIIVVDVSFFRNHFWERLTANIGIVLVFAAFYWIFLKDRF